MNFHLIHKLLMENALWQAEQHPLSSRLRMIATRRQAVRALVWLRWQATDTVHAGAAETLFLCSSDSHGCMVYTFQWWPRWWANGNSTRILKDDLSASLRYCTVPFIIFTRCWLIYSPRPSLETPWLWWNISWTKSSGIPGAGWVILRYNRSKSTALFLFFI